MTVSPLVGPHRPEHLLLQWHVTERCNKRCRHCYQEGPLPAELPLDALLGILEQFTELVSELRRATRSYRPTAHITVTGGEPFVRDDFFALLEAFAARRRLLSFAILTNGSLIDDAAARRLATLRPSFVQLSVEGTPTTHDAIRGRRDHAQVVETLRRLRRHGLYTLISFTAHRDNYTEFLDVVRLGARVGADRVWADRLIPAGRGEAMQSLAPEEARAFFELMRRAQAEQRARRLRRSTQVTMGRALQFLVAGGRPYRCTAGDTLITVLSDGTLVPCRRMPIPVGNVLETPLAELYQTSELCCALRDPRRVSAACKGCEHAALCRGGLRCLSYALTGDPFTADPGCWIAAPSAAQQPQPDVELGAGSCERCVADAHGTAR